MAERIAAVLPDVADRVVVRMHPVSAGSDPAPPSGSLILCPVLFAPYKHMADRLAEWLAAVDEAMDDSVRMIVTASPAEVPPSLADQPAAALRGAAQPDESCADLWATQPGDLLPDRAWSRSAARWRRRGSTGGRSSPRDTPQNREIAGPALCGYTVGDPGSLRHATETALAARSAPDPAPFRPGRLLRLDARKGAGTPMSPRTRARRARPPPHPVPHPALPAAHGAGQRPSSMSCT